MTCRWGVCHGTALLLLPQQLGDRSWEGRARVCVEGGGGGGARVCVCVGGGGACVRVGWVGGGRLVRYLYAQVMRSEIVVAAGASVIAD